MVTLGTVLIALLIGGLGTKLSDKTLLSMLDLLGKPSAAFVCAGFLLVLLHFTATEVRLYSEVLVGLFTPDTPIPFIIAVMVFLAAVAVYWGLRQSGEQSTCLRLSTCFSSFSPCSADSRSSMGGL